MKNIYGFLVKTDKYAGNFEREMCAYMTGCIGECQVGKEYRDYDFTEKHFPNILHVADEHGCHRPVSMLAADEKFNTDLSHTEKINSLVIYFYTPLTPEQIALLKERAEEFAQMYNLNIVGYEFLASTITTKRTNI